MATGTTEAPLDVGQSAATGLLDGGPAFEQPTCPLRTLPGVKTRQRPRTGRPFPQPVAPADSRQRQHYPLTAPGGNRSPAYLAAKRLLDIVGTLGLLVLLGPIMLVVFLILLVTTRGRPLFWQRRAGHCGRPFLVLKFRTMALDAVRRQHEVHNEHHGPIFKNRRDPRITRLGRLLRKTSLDETPQLFHVLLGQMSLVGPRPMDCREVARFEPWQLGRLAVKPGLTCLWQVSGRSNIGFEDWMRLDLWYVRNQGLWTDLKLLLRTPASVVSGQGAY